MTINKVANTDDVEYAADNFGFNKEFNYEMPPHTKKSGQGNSAITFGTQGAKTGFSSTAGESISLSVGEWPTDPFSRVILDGVFLPQSTPITHKLGVGMFRNFSNESGYYWDLTNEELVVSSTTTSMTTPFDSYHRTYFRFDIDVDAVETTLTATARGQTETATIPSTSLFLRENAIYGESTSGGSGEILLTNLRLSLIR